MTLDITAITSQKIAEGLIENPCAEVLRECAAKVPADQAVVELGAYRGRSTGWLALGASEGNGARVVSIDPWDDAPDLPDTYRDKAVTVALYNATETRLAYEAHLERTGVRPLVDTVQATAVDAAKQYAGPKVGLLFHDALHRLEDVRDDLKAWLPHMADVAVIVLHDAGDPRLGVETGAKAALTRTKAAREKWDWAGREICLWPKQPTRRGFLVVRTVA